MWLGKGETQKHQALQRELQNHDEATKEKAILSQAQLAEAIGTSQAAVAHYEMGIKAPELAKLPAIGKALGVSMADLFKEEQSAHRRLR